MRRGDIVIVALQGDHGKPRPALIIQADQLQASTHVAVLLLTSVPADGPFMRVDVPATVQTGLVTGSYVMLDRITTAPRHKISSVFGHADDVTMLSVTRALAMFLGFA